MSLVCGNFEKRFGLEVSISKIGVLVGIKGIYTFGKYRKYINKQEGIDEWIDDDYIFLPNVWKENDKLNYVLPSLGIFWMNRDAIVKICYEYTDLKMPETPPDVTTVDFTQISEHRIVFSFIYCFNFSYKTGF